MGNDDHKTEDGGLDDTSIPGLDGDVEPDLEDEPLPGLDDEPPPPLEGEPASPLEDEPAPCPPEPASTEPEALTEERPPPPPRSRVDDDDDDRDDDRDDDDDHDDDDDDDGPRRRRRRGSRDDDRWTYERQVELADEATQPEQPGRAPSVETEAKAAAERAAREIGLDPDPPTPPPRSRSRFIMVGGAVAFVTIVAIGAATLGGGSNKNPTTSETTRAVSAGDPADQTNETETNDPQPGIADTPGDDNAQAGGDAPTVVPSLGEFLAGGAGDPQYAAGVSKDNVYTDSGGELPEEVNFTVRIHRLEDGTFVISFAGELESILAASFEVAPFDGDPKPRTLIQGNTDVDIFVDEHLSTADPGSVLSLADAPRAASDEAAPGQAVVIVRTPMNEADGATTVFFDAFAQTPDGGTAIANGIFQRLFALRKQGEFPGFDALPEAKPGRPSLLLVVEPDLVDEGTN